MMEHLRRVLGFALTLASGLASGCGPCNDQDTLVVTIPALNAKVEQTVVVRLRHSQADEPSVTCSWGSAMATPQQRWTCTPKPDNGDAEAAAENKYPLLPTSLYFLIPDPASTWLVEVAGPSDTQTLTRTPDERKAGAEACGGPTFELSLTADELRAIGAVTAS